MRRWRLTVVLAGAALVLGLLSLAMSLRIRAWADGHWDTRLPPGFGLTLGVYRWSGFLALCVATAAVLSVRAGNRRLASLLCRPLAERSPLHPAFLVLLYPLALLLFATSYHVPLLGRVSEAMEEPMGLLFYPFVALGAERWLAPVAGGFSGRASEHGPPHLMWLFVVVLALMAYLAARGAFWFTHRSSERKGGEGA